jgi:HEAT repeat protein
MARRESVILLLTFAVAALGSCPVRAADAKPLSYRGKTVKAWIDELKDPDKEVRREAARALERLGPCVKEASLPALKAALKTDDDQFAYYLYGAIAAMGPETLPVLLDALSSDKRQRQVTNALSSLGEAAAPQLLKMLADGEVRQRRAAAEKLAIVGPPSPELLRGLTRALRDQDALVRVTAAESLLTRQWDSRAAMDAIIELAQSKHPEVRLRAVNLLPGTRAIPVLESAAQDKSAEIRITALCKLWAIAHLDPVPRLIEMIKGTDAKARRVAIGRLGVSFFSEKLDAPEAIPVLKKILHDRKKHDAETVRATVFALLAASAKDRELLPAILELQQNEDAAIRRNSGFFLGWHMNIIEARKGKQDLGLAAELLQALRHPGPADRGTIIFALSRLGEASRVAIPSLEKALKDTAHPGTQESAAYALGELGEVAKPALPALRRALTDKALGVRIKAAAALLSVAPQDCEQAVRVLIADAATRDHTNYGDHLKKLGPALVASYLKLLKDKDPRVRKAVLYAFAEDQAVARKAQPALKAAQSDGDGDVRTLAAGVLVFLDGDKAEASARLIDGLASRDLYVRLWTASTLRKMGPRAKPAVSALIAAYKDVDFPDLRSAILQALGAIGPDARAAGPLLLALMKDGNSHAGDAVGAFDMIKPMDAAIYPVLVGMLTGWQSGWAERRIEQAGEKAVPALLKALKAEDPDMRAAAARAIGAIKGGEEDDVRRLLRERLKDYFARVRLAAAAALLKREPNARPAAEDAHATAKAALKHNDPTVRLQALALLVFPSKLEDREARITPLVVDALRDRDALIRCSALEHLSQEAESAKPHIPAFEKALKDDDARVREAAVKALGGSIRDPDRLLPILKEALRDDSAEVRKAAFYRAVDLGSSDRTIVQHLVSAILLAGGEQSSFLNALARYGGANKGVPEALVALFQKTRNRRLREDIAREGNALPDGGRALVPTLERLLASEDFYERRWAANTLESIDPANKLLPPVVAEVMGRDADGGAYQHVEKPLGKEDPRPKYSPESVAAYAKLLGDKNENRRVGAARMLARMGTDAADAAKSLRAALKDHDPRVRLYAAEALWRTVGEKKPALAALQELRQSKDARQRKLGVVKLIPMGHKAASAVPELVDMLKTADDELAGSILHALGAIGLNAEPAVPAVLSIARDTDSTLRADAVFTLGKIGPKAKAAVPLLLKLIEDMKSPYRDDAIQALRSIDPKAAEKAGVGGDDGKER